MANIILDAGKLKVMEFLHELCAYAGFKDGYADEVWQELTKHPKIYEEFAYYIDHHELLGKYYIEGYNVLDCYVWQRINYIFRYLDRGKIEHDCNEETMVILAFDFFMKMEDDPQPYLEKLDEDLGRDKMR
ncbi:MAG: hypothetical protein PUF12_07145 [Thermoflexaceae bacterium]|nr:hypothetical protein [Thermoflexaceae bacterium]